MKCITLLNSAGGLHGAGRSDRVRLDDVGAPSGAAALDPLPPSLRHRRPQSADLRQEPQ